MRALLLLFALAVAATAEASDHPLEAAREAWRAAMLAGDAAAAAAVFAEDATSLPPREPAFLGRAAIEARYRDTLAHMRATRLDMTPLETRMDGRIAVERGWFSAVWTAPDGTNPYEVKGRYLLMGRSSSDGAWQIVLEMHTSEPDLEADAR